MSPGSRPSGRCPLAGGSAFGAGERRAAGGVRRSELPLAPHAIPAFPKGVQRFRARGTHWGRRRGRLPSTPRTGRSDGVQRRRLPDAAAAIALSRPDSRSTSIPDPGQPAVAKQPHHAGARRARGWRTSPYRWLQRVVLFLRGQTVAPKRRLRLLYPVKRLLPALGGQNVSRGGSVGWDWAWADIGRRRRAWGTLSVTDCARLWSAEASGLTRGHVTASRFALLLDPAA
jgi:hypothetical protein